MNSACVSYGPLNSIRDVVLIFHPSRITIRIGNELYSLNLTAAPLVVKIGISLLYG